MEVTIFGFSEAPLFCIELMLAEMVYFIVTRRKKNFWILFPVLISIWFIISAHIDNITLWKWFHITPLLIWLISIVCGFLLFEVNVKEIIFLSIAGLTTQHISILFGEMTVELLKIKQGTFLKSVIYTVVYLISCFVCYHLFSRRMKLDQQVEIKSNSLVVISGLILALTMVLRMIAVDNLDLSKNPIILRYVLNLYGIMGCIATLWMLFSFNEADKLEMDRILIEQLMKMEEEKHRFSESTIDMVNIKCHDLKHQIRELRKEQVREDYREVLKEVENSIVFYDKIAKTGNDVLDSILTEKNLYCQKYNINFTYIVDGKIMEFMHNTDMYSLFGNIIDNAIESVIKEEDEQKRIIFLKIFQRNQYVSIHSENYCAVSVELKNGIPVTSKRDKNYHGFGVKSMMHIVNKYGGNIVFKAQNQMFYIDILFDLG